MEQIQNILLERDPCHLSKYKSGIKSLINRTLIKTLYPKANLVFANSKGNAVDLEKNFNVKNVEVIYNPFDIDNIQKLSKESAKLKDGFNLITVGRLDEGKNHQLLIRAMKKINGNLYIIGDGELRDKLEKLISDLNLKNRVFLLGKQKNPYKFLSKADIFLFSSNREGFPNVLVEALACELPIISTDCKSGPREILAPESNITYSLKESIEIANYGILTPINSIEKMIEAIEVLQKNSKLMLEYKKKSLNRAKQFHKNRIIDDFISIMENS